MENAPTQVKIIYFNSALTESGATISSTLVLLTSSQRNLKNWNTCSAFLLPDIIAVDMSFVRNMNHEIMVKDESTSCWSALCRLFDVRKI